MSFSIPIEGNSMSQFEDLTPGVAKGRFDGIERNYGPEEVERLRGSE